jgi:hypothetical protein
MVSATKNQTALVVGLGTEARPWLDRVAARFKNVAAGDCATLWLPPKPHPEREDCLPLTLTDDDLDSIYHDPNMRIWSAANWLDWKDRIRMTRLHGKLATFHHTIAIYDRIQNLRKTLDTRVDRPLNLYLIAHLHDPFASGAMLDVAYLLHYAALKYRARVYGILILPGLLTDPLIPASLDYDQRRWKCATAYAALRELNFALDRRSLYNNHLPGLRISYQNESPFSLGDCYLVGGRTDMAQQVLATEQVQQEVAEFIYWQTVSPIRNLLPNSTQYGVSAFGLAKSTDRLDKPDVVLEVRRESYIAGLVQALLGKRYEVIPQWALAETKFEFHPRVDTSEYQAKFELVTLSQNSEANQQSADRQLEELEERYTDAINALIKTYQSSLNSKVSKDVSDKFKQLSLELETERKLAVCTVERLDRRQQQLLDNLDREIRKAEDHVKSTGDQLEKAVKEFREARNQWLYWGEKTQFRIVIWLLRCLITLVLAVLGGIWLGLFTGVIGGVLGFIVGRWINGWLEDSEQKQRKIAGSKLSTTRRETVNAQFKIIEARATQNYLTMLKDELIKSISYGSNPETFTEIFRDTLVSLLREYGTKPNLTPISPPKGIDLDALWQHMKQWIGKETDTQISVVALKEKIKEYVIQTGQQIAQESISKNPLELLQQRLEQLRPQASPLLALNFAEIKVEDLAKKSEVLMIVDPKSRPTLEIEELLRKQSAPLLWIEKPELSTEIALVRLQQNIPIRALAQIDEWRNNYLESIKVMENPSNPLRCYAMLHPTRSGVASPDIFFHSSYNPTPKAIARQIAKLHILQLKDDEPSRELTRSLREWMRKLQLSDELPLNFDELCGALHTSPGEVRKEFQEQMIPFLSMNASEQVGDVQIKISEEYADWELWGLENEHA